MFTSSFIVSLLVLNLGFPVDAKWIERIHYGRRSDIPSVLLLRTYKDNEVGICSSTLIKPQYILTAAHCNPGSYQRMTVTYGCNDIDSPNCREVKVVQFNVPKSYRQMPEELHIDIFENYYDIAIGKLAHPIDDIKPMSLPRRSQRLPESSAIIVGWGKDERGISGQFQQSGKISIMNIPEAPKDKIFLNQSPFGSFIDGGDSGGPLLAKNTVFGVASITPEECNNSLFCVAIYTSVIDNLDFIKEHTSSTEGFDY